MKAFITRLSIALSTFLIGIAITSVFVFLNQMPEVKVVTDNIDSVFTDTNEFSDNGIQIQYSKTLVYENINRGVFVVTNKLKKSIYYSGSKTRHIGNWTKQGDKVEKATFIFCPYGIGWEELKPNESAKFEINIPKNGEPFEAGFTFSRSKEGGAEITWVKVDKQQKFNATSLNDE